jgi:23S rRNA (cytosine1962-C5)-methyltransferase
VATAVLRLKRGREHRARVHPWIFKGDVADVTDVPAGSPIMIIDASGRFIGRGFYNPRPALCCRILTWDDEPLDRDFLRRRISAAVGRRRDASGVPALARLVWSEGDGLPGLVVDRYGPALVVQCLTLGMARMRPVVVEGLRAVMGDLPAFAWDDEVAARFEGFQPFRSWVGPSGPIEPPIRAPIVVEEPPVRFEIVFGQGQKTGLYLDQSENRRALGRLARGRRVLDAFAYTAGFACHALAGGATGALCLESGGDALAAARRNLALNGLADRAEVHAGNVFDELRRLDGDGARFGLIVLDPPPFARSRDAVPAAARGYKEINLRAMKLLEPGGILATFSCSHHVSDELFAEICRDAAADAGVTLRIVERLRQSADHPVLLTVPETGYLKGLLLEAV